MEFLPGLEGLVHVSELDVGRVVTAEGFLADKPKVCLAIALGRGKASHLRRLLAMCVHAL